MQTDETRIEVTAATIEAMLAAQTAAAREFRAWPPAEWHTEFQAQWLISHGLPATVSGGGLTWGAAA